MRFRPRPLVLALSFARFPSSPSPRPREAEGDRPRRLRQGREAVRGLLPVRERRVARRAPDPRRPQPLRQLRRARGPQPRRREEDPRGDVREDGLAEGLAAAEGLRLLRDRDGRRGAREGGRRAARAGLRDDREAQGRRRPPRRPRRAAPLGRERRLRLPRRAGRAELHALHRDPEPGRPRPPGPRLLPQGRRRSRRTSARRTARTSRRCSSSSATRRRRRRPRPTSSWRSRRSSPRSSITRVENRDPQKTYNKRTLAALNAEAPGFDFAKFLADIGASAVHRGERAAARASSSAFAALARSVPPADWRTYLRWHAARSAAPLLSKAFQDEDFAFNGKKLNGTPEQEPPWRRVQAATDTALGEAVGPDLRRARLQPEGQGAHAGPRREHARRAQGAHRRAARG